MAPLLIIIADGLPFNNYSWWLIIKADGPPNIILKNVVQYNPQLQFPGIFVLLISFMELVGKSHAAAYYQIKLQLVDILGVAY